MEQMKTVLFDGGTISPAAIGEALSFPLYFGGNLDALYDCLTEIGTPTAIVVTDAAAADRTILRVLRDAARENSNLTLTEV